MPLRSAVEAYKTEIIGFALPLFTTEFKGYLKIQFLEKNGSRNTDVEISAKELAKVEVFRD
jgi:hypothetical protein